MISYSLSDGVRLASVEIPRLFVYVGSILPIEDRFYRRFYRRCYQFHTIRVATVCHHHNSSPNLAGDLC